MFSNQLRRNVGGIKCVMALLIAMSLYCLGYRIRSCRIVDHMSPVPSVGQLEIARGSFSSVSPVRDGNTPNYTCDLLKHGIALNNDKVTSHSYHIPYCWYFEPIRHLPLRMLEIGMGCHHRSVVGLSALMWKQYFGHSLKLWEDNIADCFTEWIPKHPGVLEGHFVGDQASPEFLKNMVKSIGDPVDIIIDDGGHAAKHQWGSWQILWPLVKPGGLYIVEDLQVSYLWDGEESWMRRTQGWMDVLMSSGTAFKAQEPRWLSLPPKDLESIHCFSELCVYRKKYS